MDNLRRENNSTNSYRTLSGTNPREAFIARNYTSSLMISASTKIHLISLALSEHFQSLRRKRWRSDHERAPAHCPDEILECFANLQPTARRVPICSDPGSHLSDDGGPNIESLVAWRRREKRPRRQGRFRGRKYYLKSTSGPRALSLFEGQCVQTNSHGDGPKNTTTLHTAQSYFDFPPEGIFLRRFHIPFMTRGSLFSPETLSQSEISRGRGQVHRPTKNKDLQLKKRQGAVAVFQSTPPSSSGCLDDASQQTKRGLLSTT